MAQGRELKFEVPPAVFHDLCAFLEFHGAKAVKAWDEQDPAYRLTGRISHLMGEISFAYSYRTRELEVNIVRTEFPGTMMLGGIRQHIEEALARHGSDPCNAPA